MIRRSSLAVVAAALGLTVLAKADDKLWLPTGQTVTPLAAPGSAFAPLTVDLPVIGKAIAGGGATTLLSHDGHTLFLLTSGYNTWNDSNGKKIPDASTEHLFVYDVASGSPSLKQDVHIPNTYSGLALSADGKALYVGGGSDDNLHFYKPDSKGAWAEDGAPAVFGHKAGNGLIKTPLVLKPETGGVAVTADGKTVLVANYENDSVNVVNTAERK